MQEGRGYGSERGHEVPSPRGEEEQRRRSHRWLVVPGAVARWVSGLRVLGQSRGFGGKNKRRVTRSSNVRTRLYVRGTSKPPAPLPQHPTDDIVHHRTTGEVTAQNPFSPYADMDYTNH